MCRLHKHQEQSVINTVLSQKKKGEIKEDSFNISFRDFDSTQKFGSGFKDWQNCGWLSKMLETLQGYCMQPLYKQFDGEKFAKYESIPPKEQCYFNIPPNITEDAKWARIHILNKAVVVGHYVGNTFYVVFLDKEHKFWAKKK